MRRGWIVSIVLMAALMAYAGSASAQTIGIAISTLNNPFFVDLRDGAQAAAAEAGVRLVVSDAQNDPNRQLSDIENFIIQGVDLIIVNPTDSAAVVPAIFQANAAGIPVITVDRGADDGQVVTHIASDNVAGGRMAGEFIVERLDGTGNVVELVGIPGTSAARDRGQGFNEVVGRVPGIRVVARQEAGFDRAMGLTVMENILQAQPRIDAVFAHNDEMALGALTAIEAAGRQGEMIVVGFDATADAVQAVQDGRMAATVAQQPILMGELAVQIAVDYLNGKQIEAFVPVPLMLVTD